MATKTKVHVEIPRFRKRHFPEPETLEISSEAWNKPGVRVAALSRLFWKHKGARAAIVKAELMLAVRDGAHYIVHCGGFVEKKSVEKAINQMADEIAEANDLPRTQRSSMLLPLVREHVLDEIAGEIHSLLPHIKSPSVGENGDKKRKGIGFVRYYIMTSPILDGSYGDAVVNRLMKMRSDIRLLKQGEDHTYLKGVGRTDEEKILGQVIGWLTPRKHRLPGQYASNFAEKEIREAEAAVLDYPAMWVVGGGGSSVSKPGGGERKRPFISLPVSYVPIPSTAGEPSVTLNQIGLRVIEANFNGEEKLIRTWSLRDLVKDERKFITGIKTGAIELHRKIVDLVKRDRMGLHVGQIADTLDVERDEVEKAVQFLIEPKASNRVTWPGLYRDEESDRINFHLDWLQERLRYPWPYDEGYHELRRLIFGCLHAGYNTTDYEYVRYKFPEIIKRFRIQVVELVGDVTGGLKHHLIHRGQILSGLNYTEQGIFAAELLGTGFYDVFVDWFKEGLGGRKAVELTKDELEQLVVLALVLFKYILGNHEGWQKENGHSPCVEFKAALISLLNFHIRKFLEAQGVSVPRLEEIIVSKIIELPEHEAVYEFPGGLRTELFHPSMARTKTTSIRAEEVLDFSRCQMVDIANFHTAINMQKYDPELGQREANQAGAMCVWTEFENGKLKRIDFGPIYSRVLHKDGRIFMSEHQFFNTSILTKPRSVHIDIDQLKNQLGLLRSPYVRVLR